MRTFKEWLFKQEYRDDAIGNLATEMLNDPSLPNKMTKNMLLSHLNGRGVSHEVINTMNEAWREYKIYRTIIS